MEGNSLKSDVQDTNQNFDTALDEVIEVKDILSNAYMQDDEIEKSKGMILELEKIEDEYSRTIDAVFVSIWITPEVIVEVYVHHKRSIPSFKR